MSSRPLSVRRRVLHHLAGVLAATGALTGCATAAEQGTPLPPADPPAPPVGPPPIVCDPLPPPVHCPEDPAQIDDLLHSRATWSEAHLVLILSPRMPNTPLAFPADPVILSGGTLVEVTREGPQVRVRVEPAGATTPIRVDVPLSCDAQAATSSLEVVPGVPGGAPEIREITEPPQPE